MHGWVPLALSFFYSPTLISIHDYWKSHSFDYMELCWQSNVSSFLKFIYFNWRLITLQYCSGFCHTLTWINHGFTYVPHLESPSHLHPHPIPLGHPSASARSTLFHASNLDWRSVSHMIIYMFQCYSLISSHSCLLPESKRLFYTSVSFLLSCI